MHTQMANRYAQSGWAGGSTLAASAAQSSSLPDALGPLPEGFGRSYSLVFICNVIPSSSSSSPTLRHLKGSELYYTLRLARLQFPSRSLEEAIESSKLHNS